MRRQSKLLAGSALGLMMAAASIAWATPNTVSAFEAETHAIAAGTIVAQSDPAPTEEELPRKKKKQQRQEKAAPEQEPQQEAAPQAEPEAQPESEPAKQEAPRKKKRQQQEAAPEQEPQQEAAPQAEPEAQSTPEQTEEQAPKKKKQQRQEKAAPEQEPQPEAAPQAEPEAQSAPEPTEEQAPRKKKQQRQEKAAPAEQQPEAAPQEAQPEPAPEVTPEQTPAPEAAPAEPTPEAAPQPEPAPQTEPEAAPTPESKPDQPAEPEGGATQGGDAQPETAPPADTAEPPADSTVPPDSGTAEGQPENAAPVLDSAKEAPTAPEGEASSESAQPAPAEPAGPPPVDDKAAQEAAQPAEVQSVTVEKGTRVEAPPPAAERQRPEGVDVVREFGDRIIVEFNNSIFVESSDRPRMTRGAREVYYEDLPRGRSRETVIREDGTQVVTIRNRNGDIIRRSRITPDGREYVLVYVDDRYYDRLDDWRDPGLDLPPMRLDVPTEEYILYADQVEDPDVYYDFLERPPVERVERLYSVDEVKRSARIRDKVPRVELDTVTFEFGSATIGESEVPRLEGVADAIERLLKKNPAETFLIEGHTDAVGSDVADLALSDRRAEAVADALSNVFGIPPENLATQGYGERYLKIKSDEQERLNRRVVIRRITPLVAPVASAN